MSRTSVIIDREMRRQGYVSAAVVSTQYGISRSQLLDFVLQGKVRPLKPDGSSVFYCNWEDCLKTFGNPIEFRSKPKDVAVAAVVDPLEPEILLDGMIPSAELEDLFRKEAAAKQSAKRGMPPPPPGQPQQRVVVRPADFANDSNKK